MQSADPSASASGRYRRLSPFNTEVREVVGEIYEDLARNARIDGLLFHDDATLDDFEDASPAAGRRSRIGDCRFDRGPPRRPGPLRQKWTERKTEALIAFTHELARVGRYQGTIKTARNLYALPVLAPETGEWFAQSLPAFLAAYDYTAVMAMPLMEGAAKPDAWLDSLVRESGHNRARWRRRSSNCRAWTGGPGLRCQPAPLVAQLRSCSSWAR